VQTIARPSDPIVQIESSRGPPRSTAFFV
jgi:hypothetical protein